MHAFSKVISTAIAAAAKVKAAVLKTISEIDNVVLPDVEKLQPTIDAIAEVAVPGSSKFVDYGVSLLEDVAHALDAGGAAAEQNLLAAGLDTAAISAIKSLIPQIKALKA